MLKDFTEFIKTCLFPIRCLGCGQFDTWLCPACFFQLPYAGSYFCLLCHDKQMKNGKVCSECKKRSSLSYIISCGVYAHPLLQETIKQWKFGASFDITYFLGELMQKTIRENYFYEWLEKYQPILIPIPIHKRKLNIRGFNQTEALANFLSEYNGLKVCSNVLLKVKNTRPQTSIPHNKRWQNIKNSYQIKNPSLVEGKNILLVDDVVTTGATLKHATYLLKKAGAKNISAVTLAFGNP